MKIAVVGNRTGWTYEDVKRELDKYGINKTDILISGGAEGVDTFAQMYAKEIGAEIIILYPDPQKPHPQRYYDRNQEIVSRCDCVIAFQNNPHRSGTQSTINRAKKRGINVIVITKEDEKNESNI